ncbi:MAG TPA: hypothetical protein PKH09_10420, partial [Parvularculaceae bacterium]|nr:hypothetical protein [Parvularculaceae bacterium]
AVSGCDGLARGGIRPPQLVCIWEIAREMDNDRCERDRPSEHIDPGVGEVSRQPDERARTP